MFRLIFVLLIIVPVIEIYLLITVGGQIGALPTIALIFITAIAGAALLRHQGLQTIARFQSELAQGQLPAQQMVEGGLLAFGGALLLTPGFLTDSIGFLCVAPGSRQWLAANIKNRVVVHGHSHFNQQQSAYTQQNGADGDVFEGDYQRKPEQSIDRDAP